MDDELVVLGLDIGSNSIGWALTYEADGETFRVPVAMGVRVFPEGVQNYDTSKEQTRNSKRREKRGLRRQIARRARRKARLKAALIESGLYPSDPYEEKTLLEKSDPYELRSKALSEPLTRFELGRVFLHLCQRRGFKSNRKSEPKKDEKPSETQQKLKELNSELHGDTLGSHLWGLRKDGERVRKKLTLRAMYLEEFDVIWNAQTIHHPDFLTDRLKYGSQGKISYPVEPIARKKSESLLQRFGIHGIIFFQRPVYWPSSSIGRCELEKRQKRAPKADRRFQRFRLLQEVNNLRIISQNGESRLLTNEQREKLVAKLAHTKSMSDKEIRKNLGILEGEFLNLEIARRKSLHGNETDNLLESDKHFGRRWRELPEDFKNQVVEVLNNPKVDDEVIRKIAVEQWRCSGEQAEALSHLRLPQGYASYSIKAIEKLLPFLERGLQLSANDETDSAVHAAYPERDRIVVEARSILPAIPRDITNPIVRQALGEVRKLVHAIIREYGKPHAIHLELARDLRMSKRERDYENQRMRKIEQIRKEAKEEIKKLVSIAEPTREDLERYLIWKDQQGICFYSKDGRHISPQQLFSGDGVVEVDHILPLSRSLDNSRKNKVICFREENQSKGNRTPYEWVGTSDPEKFETIKQNVKLLPHHLRAAQQALISQETIELDGFVARQLNDTRYISKVLNSYLKTLGVKVLNIKGQQTAILRRTWGLNGLLNDDQTDIKNRGDHRHHAVDALVIAMTNHRTLHKLAQYHKLRSEHAREMLQNKRFGRPDESFRNQVQQIVDEIVVSHKARRRVSGALHDETIYSPTWKPEKAKPGPRDHLDGWTEEKDTYAIRKELARLSVDEILSIRDKQVRTLVLERLAQFGVDIEKGDPLPKEKWYESLRMVGKRGAEKSPNAPVIEKVRILVKDKTIRKIRNGLAFVKPNDNHHVSLFRVPSDNKKGFFIDMVATTLIEAASRVQKKLPVVSHVHPEYPDAVFLFSLSKGEMVEGTIRGTFGRFVLRKSQATETTDDSKGTKNLTFALLNDAKKEYRKFNVAPNQFDGKKIVVDRLGRISDARD